MCSSATAGHNLMVKGARTTTILWISSTWSATAVALLVMGWCSSSALSLPDSRVYELVSPAQKSGGVGSVLPLATLVASEQFGLPLQSSPSGEAVAYEGEDFYEPRLGSSLDEYLSLRDPGAWVTQNLTPGVPAESETTDHVNLDVGFSPDLSAGIISSEAPLAKAAPTGYANLYLARGASLQPLLLEPPPHRTSTTFGHAGGRGVRLRLLRSLLFAGGNNGTEAASAFSHLLFEANDSLTSATATAPAAIDGGELENNLYEWTAGSMRLVNVLPNGQTEPNASFGIDYGDEYGNDPTPSLSHVISADGSRIFWTDENSSGPNNGNLYVREDGERTRLIASSAQFQTANTDGSRVFFTKAERLYEYDTTNGATTDLASSGVQGIVGASQEGTYIYFVSQSRLTDEGGETGQPNLYLTHEGETRFIATLLPSDNEIVGLRGSSPSEGDWYRTFAGRSAEVSPNGRYVAFMSEKDLTGYNNLDANGSRHDSEIFLYDAANATLTCASCNVDGRSPTTNTWLPSPVNGIYQQRYLDDFGRLFFSTEDAVLPQDTDGTSDVYEYENGHVYLISPGDANSEAVFADASESGDDVFFTTRQQLVPGDNDQNVDLYDARVDGWAEEPPLPACSSEVCHEPALTPPSFEAPVSAAFTGPTNLPPPSSKPVMKSKALTRAQKLVKALRLCRLKQNRHSRVACEARARKRY